ncbi:uncharacterized protein BXZ73DRAFT_55556 [Epithele typhae]|uniref:uncharacterized protein n=1 Tax=Epithele typhae TaxID=378194 RepID=UPI0020073274|nr:uncharacterized protein BXZ73DRAFT_55556 [Epithele typhae]KAH9913322.1 hypothetical protein BXZ73DRAFT_55556 [Epithele typhae]
MEKHFERPTLSIPSRPSLPTSSSDFALPSSPSSALATSSTDDLSPFLLRLRRPSNLRSRGSDGSPPDHRLHSPLISSFTRRYSQGGSGLGEDSESDRDKMSTDGESGHATPLLPGPVIDTDSDTSMKTSRPRTPPRLTSASSSSSGNEDQPTRAHNRRLSHPVRVPRILALVQESHLQDNEAKSEAQFQRILASLSDLPSHPRTPRAPSDRGRYPEEAVGDDAHRESSPSDDEDEVDESAPAFSYSESVVATKPVTPAHSVNGDELSMLDSPIGVAMDVDMPSSVLSSPVVSSWRYTPPPTTSAVRNNKRKLDDRYDPYPTSAKRRAVSPSISHLREAFNGRHSGAPRLSMPIPIPIQNGMHSGSSSPIVPGSSSYWSARQSFGSASVLSSPTLRAQIGLASPVLRPMTRARREGEREVDSTEEGVNGLSIA